MLQTAAPTRSQLFPVVAKWRELGSKSQFRPMAITLLAVFAMFNYAGDGTTIVYQTGDDPQE